MAENYSDQSLLEENIRRLNEQLDRGTSGMSVSERAKRAAAQAERQYSAAEERNAQFVGKAISGLATFSQTMTNSGGSFNSFNAIIDVTATVAKGFVSIVPVIGDIAASIIDGIADATKFMLESFQKSYSQFEKLSDVGIVSTFEGLLSSGNQLSLNFADTAKVLSKNSVALAGLGGGAEAGRKYLEATVAGAREARDEFRYIGINAADFTETITSYLDFEHRVQPNRQRNAFIDSQNAIEYAKNLDVLSKLTGVSRKELETKRTDMLRDTRYRAGIANLDKPARENITNLIQTVASMDADAADGLKDLIAGSGNPGKSEKAKSMYLSLQESGIDVQDFIGQLRSGAMTDAQAMQLIASKAPEYVKRFGTLISSVGTDTKLTKNAVFMHNAAAKAGQNLVREQKTLRANQAAALQGTDTMGKKLADTSTSLYNTGQMIEQLATSSETMTEYMRFFSNSVSSVTEKLYSLVGSQAPKLVKLRTEERKIEENIRDNLAKIQKLKTQGVKDDSSLIKDLITANELNRKQLDTARANTKREVDEQNRRNETPPPPVRSSAAPSGGAPSAGPTTARLPGPGDEPKASGQLAGIPMSTIRSKTGKGAQVATAYAKNFQGLVDWFDSQGYVIKSMGGYADRNIAGTNTPSYHSRGAAIDINPAENPYGRARITDMPDGTREAARAMGLGWGLDWPSISDAMHFSAGRFELGSLTARTGGIFSGPDSGYPIEVHGDEAVIDLDQGVSQRSLNTSEIPTDNSDVELVAFLDSIAKKFQDATEIVKDGISKQKTHATFNG